MYAIIKTGSKQYKVAKGDVIDIEKLSAEGSVTFDDVLFLFDGKDYLVGQPCVKGAAVVGEILGESAGDKIQGVKYKRRKRQVRKFGHRQHYTRIKITGIKYGSAKAADAAPEAVEEAAVKAEKKAPAKPKAAAKPKTAAKPKETAEAKAPKKPAAKKTKTEA